MRKIVEIKTGLCPNCHKFGDTCTCGYNYGFVSGAELRKYKTWLSEPQELTGKIVSKTLYTLGIQPRVGLQVWYEGAGVLTIAAPPIHGGEYQDDEISLDYAKTRAEKHELSMIGVEYLKDGVATFIPLKYNFWTEVVERHQVNSGSSVPFVIQYAKCKGKYQLTGKDTYRCEKCEDILVLGAGRTISTSGLCSVSNVQRAKLR